MIRAVSRLGSWRNPVSHGCFRGFQSGRPCFVWKDLLKPPSSGPPQPPSKPPSPPSQPPSTPAGGFLASAKAANAVARPSLRHLTAAPTVGVEAGLGVSHTAIHMGGDKYLIDLKIRAKAPAAQAPWLKPAHIVCAVDVSGSMSMAASHNDSDREFSMFSRKDLVQNSLTTIVSCLRPVDTLSLVTFSDGAQPLLKRVSMDSNGKRAALAAIDRIEPNGMTNLYDGLVTALDMAEEKTEPGANQFAVLLTDGEPNVNPPRGILEEFVRRYKEKNAAGPKAALSTFGYGYGLDSRLLAQLATLGGGIFAHIPDHTMCNTVFINYLTNCLVTAHNRLRITTNPAHGCDAVRVLPQSQAPGSPLTNLGTVQWDLARSVLVRANIPDRDRFRLEFELDNGGREIDPVLRYRVDESNLNLLDDAVRVGSGHMETFYRFSVAGLSDIIESGLNRATSGGPLDLQPTRSELEQFVATLSKMAERKDDPLSAKFADLVENVQHADTLKGQVCKAFSNDEWFQRWGRHYLPYFLLSHWREVCSNFKDQSLQHYGGQLFREVREEVESIFATIPPPKPTRSSEPFRGNWQASTHNASGPCLHGDGYVQVVRGRGRPRWSLVQDLRSGDKVRLPDGSFAKIVCVIRTQIEECHTWMSEINGVKMTPFHPVRVPDRPPKTPATMAPHTPHTPQKDDARPPKAPATMAPHNEDAKPETAAVDDGWRYPYELETPTWVPCDHVYNFVLSRGHVLTVHARPNAFGPVEHITLGHGVVQHPLLSHPFLGTDAVIRHLKSHPEWQRGKIELTEWSPTFDPTSRLMTSFW